MEKGRRDEWIRWVLEQLRERWLRWLLVATVAGSTVAVTRPTPKEKPFELTREVLAGVLLEVLGELELERPRWSADCNEIAGCDTCLCCPRAEILSSRAKKELIE